MRTWLLAGTLVGTLAGLAGLAGCGATPPVHDKPRAERAPEPSFAQRPLKIEVEGTSEKRQPFDVTFVGVEVVGPFSQGELRTIANVLARDLKLTPTTLPAGTIASQCPTVAPDCMAAIGAQVGAKHLLWGTLAIERGTVTTSLFVLDVAANRVLRKWTETLALEKLRRDEARALMERGRIAVLGAEASTLLVESAVDGSLYVDGALHGKLAVPHTSVRLAAGKHRIRIESRGFASTEREVDIPASHFVRVVVKK